jgi:lipoate-protein ligase A
VNDWRFIRDAAASGPVNMARDQYALLRAIETGRPILRLYDWERLVLSVGRNQKLDRQVNLPACREAGVPVVRRMTGGRGVLHGTDLTYAVASPTDGGRFSPGIMAVYRELSGVFVRFFRELGLVPEVKTYGGSDRAERASAVCFATPSAFEILLDGRKVVGSAQRLMPHGFLQHGSIPLEPQQDVLARIFRDVSRGEVRAQMTDLRTAGVLGRLDREGVVQVLLEAFEDVLGIRLEPEPWTRSELDAAGALESSFAYLKYEGQGALAAALPG